MTLRLERTDAVARITLDRPDQGNAIDLPLARALLDAVIVCDDDPAIRCVLLTGAGKMFCVGGDIAAFADAGENVPSFIAELADTLHQSVLRLAGMAKPLVVAVNGPAAGAGMSLALAGDIVIAHPAAHFTAAYTAIGLTPDGALSWLLPRLIGLRRSQELLLTNRRVVAAEAIAIGLITRVEQDALAAANDAAVTLSTGATGALGAVRALLRESSSTSLTAHLDREAEAITQASAGAEAREGVAAFRDRRSPNFAAS